MTANNSINDLIKEGIELFEAKQYDEAIQKLNQALELITDKTSNLKQKDAITYKNLTYRLLGLCYFTQAQQSKDTALFEQARKYFHKRLLLAEQLDGNEGIQEQIDAQFWLGRCYLEQALQTKDTALFEQTRKHFHKRLLLAEQLDGNEGIQQQINAQHWLGYCYLKQTLQSKNVALFEQARKHFHKRLLLAEQLDRNEGIQEQIDAQFWLGRCYFEQALQSENVALFEQARKQFQRQLALAKRLDGDNGIQEQVYAQFWLGLCDLEEIKAESSQPKDETIQSSREYFDKALELLGEPAFDTQLESAIQAFLRELDFLAEEYEVYFDNKQEYIQDKLPENLDDGLKKILASILAVLSVSPIEFDKPLAHYTNPNVCEKLLGIDPKQENQEEIPVHKMRMNSSTYMNDPYEGRSLLDLLSIYETALENLSECSFHNAFFACFSARVNDLNQFRLYGKVGNTEASGCCLVFNKNGDWIREPDISASYQRLNSLSGLNGEAVVAETPSENLPLYQIAYIFYREEYTQDDEYDVMKLANKKRRANLELNKKFGVRLKPISDNNDWHKIRAKKLQIALDDLQKYFQNKEKEKSQTNKVALEYIRYLFKDYAFRDEEEFRLLKIEESGSDKVKYCPITHSTYLEYDDICDKLDEVILGTNYERTFKKLKVEVFRHLLKRKNLNIKVSHSSLPINPAGR